jgi:4-hydroxy-tetrahydrodipicolinate reductase
MIRVAVNGAYGKMGKMVVSSIDRDDELELVGGFDQAEVLSDVIRETKPDVVVDFTTASEGFKNAKIIIESGAHPVIGTTGFSEQQVKELQHLCQLKKLGGIIAPNFSIGAVLMMHISQQCAQYLTHAEIIEMHHDEKKDAPSGTALKTAEMMGDKISPTLIDGEKELFPGARGAIKNSVHIHSIRLPGFVAHQQVIFGGIGETLTIRHDTISREAFMPGVLLAIKKVPQLSTLLHGLEHLLFT